MSNLPVVVSHDGIETQDFWKAVKIWLRNPHVVNRRILTNKKLLFVHSNIAIESIGTCEWIERLKNVVKLHEDNSDPGETDIFKALNLDESFHIPESFAIDDSLDNSSSVYLQKLLPRNPEKFSQTLELSLIDRSRKRIKFISNFIDKSKQSLSLKWPYGIEFDSELNKVSLQIEKEEEKEDLDKDPSVKWLREQFFPRFIKWTDGDDLTSGLISGSLNLIPVEKYAILYNELKKKYGVEMVKIWPENTDPSKFVYEDVAIATYLLILWEIERKEKSLENKQSFVDLGCGNGLLVHILSSEGHSGLGIDLRKRNIWDLYPKTTRLEIRTIVPSASSLFPEFDWLIGNHSDELTPWIPVIAARSSYRCKFFLLPCCAYEFDGRKYQRNSASKSQYFEYMNYMKKVCEDCGFKTDLDKLRIPSTKRICLIGGERTYTEENKVLQENTIRILINARSTINEKEKTNGGNTSDDANSWSADFKPREIIEKVRNCTKVDKNLISDIVNLVSRELLSKVRMIDVEGFDKEWNAGGQIELSQIAGLLSQEILKELKNECGGLQTLLKNNGHIFQIVEGKVQFRIPSIGPEIIRKKKKNKQSNLRSSARKSKICWFYQNHPNGCPINDEICNFKHSD